MKTIQIGLVVSLLFSSTILLAESKYEEGKRKEQAYKSVSVVDYNSCIKHVKLEFEWRWFMAQGNANSSTYPDTHAHYKKLAYLECKKNWGR